MSSIWIHMQCRYFGWDLAMWYSNLPFRAGFVVKCMVLCIASSYMHQALHPEYVSKLFLWSLLHIINSGYICYDDGCHLRKFAQNPIRHEVNATSKQLAEENITIDKMYMKGHTDVWCKEHWPKQEAWPWKSVPICNKCFALSYRLRLTQKLSHDYQNM